MKVLYVHQHFSTPQGAAGIRSYQMARRLVARGHRVVVICGAEVRGNTGLNEPFVNGVRRGVVDGIEVIEFDLSYSNNDGFLKRSLTFLRYAWRSCAIVLNEPFDLLFATSTPLTTGIVGIWGKIVRRAIFVFEVRDLWPELPRAMGVIRNPIVLTLMSWLEWVSYHLADRLVGLSPGIVDGIARRGIDRGRITLIPNGCDLTMFGGDVSSWRPPAVAATDLMAVFAGAHGLANGLEAIVDVAIELERRQRNDIKLVLVGSGKTKAQLEDRARQSNLSNIVFLQPIDKRKLAGLLKGSDLGLQILANVPAFYYGTSPNKFFDYLAGGLPVLVNYPGWVADLLQQHDCGYSVEPDDAERFADALVYVADHREELKAKGKNARLLAESKFNLDSLGDQFVGWLEKARA